MDEAQYRQMYDVEDTHWWFLAKRAFVQSVLPQPSKPLHILDIGAGTGGMSAYLTRWGTVFALEKSPHAIPYLRKRKITYLHQSACACSFTPHSFDMICMFDVLYHRDIGSDQQMIHNMYRWLKPGGKVCITDCAVPFLYSHHDTSMHAAKRYWLSELEEKLRKEKFIITKASYIYFFTFPIFVLTRVIDKVIPYNTMKKMPIIINKMFLTVCQLESRLLKYVKFPIGSSILIVAKKS